MDKYETFHPEETKSAFYTSDDARAKLAIMFFLLPDLTHYATKHSYIIELKMLPKKDYSAMSQEGVRTKAEVQWLEAVEQINRYAAAPRVEALRQGTQLHKIIMQFEGWEMKRMEEIV